MTAPMVRSLLFAVLLAVAAPAVAQDFNAAQRERDLKSLAAVFGELHHIRRMCEPRYESDVWRDRMKQLIDLEQPSPALRQGLVAAFNDGYRGGQARFAFCDRDAEDYAAARADEGQAIVARLSAPLEAAAAEDGPFTWTAEGARPGERN